MERTKIGTRLRELRKKANITQTELSERLGITQGSISLWESGETKPDVENLLKISEIFGCTVDSLLKGSEYSN